jgi:hypothetical protein
LLCIILTSCSFNVRDLLLPHLLFSFSFSAIIIFGSSFRWIIFSLKLSLVAVRCALSRLYGSIRWISVLERKEFSPYALRIDFARLVGSLFVSRIYFLIKNISYFILPIFSNKVIPNLPTFSNFYFAIAYN